MNLKVKICGIEFKNPLIAASGTFGCGREYNEFYDVSVLGGIVTKAVTLEKRQGNPAPRIVETAGGILNSVGLQNPGFEEFVKKDMPFLKKLGTVKIVNIAGSTREDYVRLAERVNGIGADAVELNISCPNVKEGGMSFGTSPDSVCKITDAVRKVCRLPLIVKLSPNVSDIADNARAAEGAGADAVSLINTLGGMAVDYRTRRPVLGNIFGGLSGPCVKPVALKAVYQCYTAVKIPIIGMGGISCAADVLEFMLCGASAVEVGTANFSAPNFFKTALKELTALLKECNIDNVGELTGALRI